MRYYWPIYLLVIALGLAYLTHYITAVIPVGFFIASLVTYGLYFKDKRAAKRGTWRIPEKTLHLASLLGGWPGAIAGQQQLRHKTQKTSFRIVFWLAVIVNIIVLTAIHTPQLQDMIKLSA